MHKWVRGDREVGQYWPLDDKTKNPESSDLLVFEVSNGANDPDRTDDLIITNDLLYQLSYVGFEKRLTI